jgi:hypothetical protein
MPVTGGGARGDGGEQLGEHIGHRDLVINQHESHRAVTNYQSATQGTCVCPTFISGAGYLDCRPRLGFDFVHGGGSQIERVASRMLTRNIQR